MVKKWLPKHIKSLQAKLRRGFKKYKRFVLLTFFLLFFDQVTKAIAFYNIPDGLYYNPIPVIPHFLYWVHVHNTGAAWGFFADKSYILAVVGIIALYIVYIYRRAIELQKAKIQWSMGLLCGGTIGNIMDRFHFGYVIDFIDVHLPYYRWPAFNLADAGITIGIMMFIYYSFFAKSCK